MTEQETGVKLEASRRGLAVTWSLLPTDPDGINSSWTKLHLREMKEGEAFSDVFVVSYCNRD